MLIKNLHPGNAGKNHVEIEGPEVIEEEEDEAAGEYLVQMILIIFAHRL